VRALLTALRQALCFHSMRGFHWIQAEDREGPGRDRICNACGKTTMRERAA
jgi:hypothetical protein